MPEELQNLLDRIQKDGVDKADAEAMEIISSAETKASEIVKKAEADATSIIEKAKNDAAAFETQGQKALQHASRDVLLSLGEAINASLQKVVISEVAKALDVATIQKMIEKVAEAYCSDKNEGSNIEIILNADQQQEVADYFVSKYAEQMKNGMQIKSSNNIISGFKVAMPDAKLEHDFSGEAVTDAFCRLLRPKIAEIVKSASKTQG